MWRTSEGSTGRLVQLCAGYFSFYVLTGVLVKYFTGDPARGYPGLLDVEFLVYSTLGGALLCFVVAVAAGWYRLKSNGSRRWAGLDLPEELVYIIPSGVCTAVVIPTTTLLYMLPISVMVAMVIMRASVIVISRAVDAVQIRQGILKKRVYREEDIAVVFALAAAGVHVVWIGPGGFAFARSSAALAILGSYVLAYSLRIYIMNFFKNTRAKGVPLDNKGFFAIEQITAGVTLAAAAAFLVWAPGGLSAMGDVVIFQKAFLEPRRMWGWATLAGAGYGVVAFFSVFIFMFKGRTATFAGLVNRLTSLVAGTAATLISWRLFDGKFPQLQDWISLGFIFVAVGFLTVAERKRAKELLAAHEIELCPSAPPAAVPAR